MHYNSSSKLPTEINNIIKVSRKQLKITYLHMNPESHPL